MKNVVIGFLGSTLDAGGTAARWEKWRPTVSICQHEDFLVHRLELLHARPHQKLAEQLIEDIASASPETTVNLHLVDPRDPWDFQEVYGKLHEFARHYVFDVEHERYLMHITTGTHVAQICMYLLTEARYFPAELLQSSPPRRQNADSTGSYAIIDLDLSKYDQLAARFAREKQDSTAFLKSGIATRNAAFNRTIDDIEQVAVRSRSPLLLIGPTGAGKSQLAGKIYELKKTRHQLQGEFVEVNCATLCGDEAMSTLFGHVKGAFTGAQTERPGLLKKAHLGIVFLDEIGELGPDEQAMLLRAIEEKRFFPMGSDKETQSDFQLIAGTNRDLRQDVRGGRFRDDLLARINHWTFRLPALRDRPEDIEPNVDYELERHTQLSSTTVRFNAEARRAFLRFATSSQALWTGNFRELSAAITRMATLADGGRITESLVDREIARLRESWAEPTSDSLRHLLSDSDLAGMDAFDRLQLEAVIGVCQKSRSLADAGRTLFGASRTRRGTINDSDRLRKFLQRFDLSWDQVVSSAAP
jgi:transcriptional regulatory protein RtcR